MNRDELISELDKLAASVRVDHPNAAIVLYTLKASIASGDDDVLAGVVQDVAHQLLTVVQNRHREMVARLN